MAIFLLVALIVEIPESESNFINHEKQREISLLDLIVTCDHISPCTGSMFQSFFSISEYLKVDGSHSLGHRIP